MDQTTLVKPPKRFQMPLLLAIGMALSAFFAITFGFVLLVFALVIPFSKSFTIDNAPATRGEFLKVALPILGLVGIAAALAGCVAYALWRERPWSRDLMMALWGGCCLVGIGVIIWGNQPRVAALIGLIETVVFAAIAYGYLYHRRVVVAYYRAITEQQSQQPNS